MIVTIVSKSSQLDTFKLSCFVFEYNSENGVSHLFPKSVVGSFTTTKYTLPETLCFASWNAALFLCSSVCLFFTCMSFWFPVVCFSLSLPRQNPPFQGQSSFYHEFKKTLSSLF